jgi:hypothetical protein
MTELMDSILQSVKKLNNVAPTYTGFDVDFIMFINAAFSDLHQLGIGPSDGNGGSRALSRIFLRVCHRGHRS